MSGLQTLIKCANHYINEHGLAFNASKTSCVIFGKCCFEQPKWFLNGMELKWDNEMKYLGAILSKTYHTNQQERLKTSHNACYGLQGSGMCTDGVKPEVVSHLWKAMIQTILLYPTLSKSDIVEMDKLHAKLIKSALGFTKYYRTTPLLNAMNANKIANLRNIYTVDLLRSMLFLANLKQ